MPGFFRRVIDSGGRWKKPGCLSSLAQSSPSHSPNMANTVNAALKPLETLSRIVNQPSSLFGTKGSTSKSKSEGDAPPSARPPGTNQPHGRLGCLGRGGGTRPGALNS